MEETRVAVLEARSLRSHASRAWQFTNRIGLQEAVVVVVSFLIYFGIRGSVVDRAGEAMVRGFSVISFEQRLGIYWELRMQSWIIDSYFLIRAMNWVYFWAHMPLIVVLAVWLYARHRRAYWLTRNAFLASGAIGVIIYALFPVAPPRLIPFGGFVDTMAVFDKVGYQAEGVKAFVNPFAAIPSLHFGWSLLMGLVVFKVSHNWAARAFAVAWPAVMFFAVVSTGNHFIIDAVAGGFVAMAGLLIAIGIERYLPAALARVRPSSDGLQTVPSSTTAES
jgi:PAP2 superfamily